MVIKMVTRDTNVFIMVSRIVRMVSMVSLVIRIASKRSGLSSVYFVWWGNVSNYNII